MSGLFDSKREFTICSKDSVRQPFTAVKMAEEVARITERMTGDKCWVESFGHAYHVALRWNGDKVVRA